MSYYHPTSWSKNSPTYFKLGLVISLALAIFIINYETKIKIDQVPTFLEDVFNVWETEVQSHSEVIPKISEPIQKPVVIETAKIIISNKADEQQLEDIKKLVPEVSNSSSIGVPKETEFVDVPIKIESTYDSDKIYTRVENMPFLSSCENLTIESERILCTQEQLMSFIRKNLKYPAIARDATIQGVVVVSFIIDKHGEAKDFTILRDIGGGCGQEAVKTLRKVGPWNPGFQNGRRVNVKYNMPIRFSLN
jgi:periplasmic protein TonB